MHGCHGFPVVRIPSLGSGKNFSLWLRKNSPYEVLMISLARFNPMETTQKKQSAQGICFYLRRKIQIAPRTRTGKITHGPQSPTWYFTPQRFSSCGPAMFSWTPPCQRPFMQWILCNTCEGCDCLYWSLPGVDPLSHCDFTLLMDFLPPSIFSFWWPVLICSPLSLLTLANCSFLLSTYKSLIRNVDSGFWNWEESKLFHFLTGIECLLLTKCSRR